ncbi:hypothetical protein [Candidatus Weimeria sp. HCP3S3_B5]|uniref:hypothetical protein n=1 Tax=Candidatus Weimeria sp. HCP3S3_B5 TaxID=3438871 RepID=UPI003F888A04
MEKAEGSEKSVREILSPQKLLTNKIIMISAASMILYCLPFRFPAMITDSISAIGSMMTPLSLIIVGLQIGSMDPSSSLLHAVGLTFGGYCRKIQQEASSCLLRRSSLNPYLLCSASP